VGVDDGVVVHAAVVTQPDRRVQVAVAVAVHHALENVDRL
jgi:Na+-transporting methylmalonyl-CoA/oxaloacetate decarboxylase gamma subunit